MSVGVPLLDADHRLFVEALNALIENGPHPARRDKVRAALGSLIRYARYHFAREEAVMAACAYPAIEAHRREHAYFLSRIEAVQKDYDAKLGAVLDPGAIAFLEDWLTDHILAWDMAYRPYVEGRAQAAEAARRFHPLFVDAL